MPTNSTAADQNPLSFWLLSVLKLYAEERVLNNGDYSPRDLPGESSATRFNRFWRWIIEGEASVETDASGPIVNPQEMEKVRADMRDEAYRVMVKRRWFMAHDRSWWVQQLRDMKELKVKAAQREKTSTRDDDSEDEDENEGGNGDTGIGGITEKKRVTPAAEVHGDGYISELE